jgi:protein-S-isoprenylcysteine O-methyltransferase Ste14
LYKFSRNPMYIGVMLILTGEAIFFRSIGLLIYAVLVFTVFNLFIIIHEEPRLKQDFGSEYEQYMARVRRWL